MLSVALLGTQQARTCLSSKHFSYGLAHGSRHSQISSSIFKYFIIKHVNHNRHYTNTNKYTTPHLPIKNINGLEVALGVSVLAGLGDGDGEDLAGAALDVHVAALLDLLSVLTSVLKKRRGEVREEGVGKSVKFGSGSKALSRIIGNAK